MKDGRMDNQETAPPPGVGRPLASLLAVAAGLLRLVPHPWNLTPVGALGIFAGARLRSWHAFALPLVVMAATDALLKVPLAQQGFPVVTWVTPFVYGSFLLNVCIGRLLTRTHSTVRIGGASLLASVQFFLVTNFGMWLNCAFIDPTGPTRYAPTVQGLIECYVKAIPFFGGTLAGDLLYCAILFGLHGWLTRRRFAAERVPAPPRLSS
jgi:hypothetical protein